MVQQERGDLYQPVRIQHHDAKGGMVHQDDCGILPSHAGKQAKEKTGSGPISRYSLIHFLFVRQKLPYHYLPHKYDISDFATFGANLLPYY